MLLSVQYELTKYPICQPFSLHFTLEMQITAILSKCFELVVGLTLLFPSDTWLYSGSFLF